MPFNALSLDIGTTLGYNNGQIGTDASINHIDLSVSSGFYLDSVCLSPSLEYVIATETSLKPDNVFTLD